MDSCEGHFVEYLAGILAYAYFQPLLGQAFTLVLSHLCGVDEMIDIMHVKLTTSGAIFHCSSKVLKELRVRNEQIENGDGAVDPFFCWYVHLFTLHRKSASFLSMY